MTTVSTFRLTNSFRNKRATLVGSAPDATLTKDRLPVPTLKGSINRVFVLTIPLRKTPLTSPTTVTLFCTVVFPMRRVRIRVSPTFGVGIDDGGPRLVTCPEDHTTFDVPVIT